MRPFVNIDPANQVRPSVNSTNWEEYHRKQRELNNLRFRRSQTLSGRLKCKLKELFSVR